MGIREYFCSQSYFHASCFSGNQNQEGKSESGSVKLISWLIRKKYFWLLSKYLMSSDEGEYTSTFARFSGTCRLIACFAESKLAC